MLEKFEKPGVLSLALAIPLSVVLQVANVKDGVSLAVNEAVAAPEVFPDGTVDYQREGTKRIFTAKGPALKSLHDLAARKFIAKVKEEIMSEDYTIGYFEAHITYENGNFAIVYKLRLTPTKKKNEAHKLIEIRGEARHGNGAKAEVIRRDEDLGNPSSIPNWQGRMKDTYGGEMNLIFEGPARTENYSPIVGQIYSQPVLAKGAYK